MRYLWRKKLQYVLVGSFLSLIFTGCDWMGKDPPPPLPGERISVMLYESEFKADPALQDVKVDMLPPAVNQDWPQSGSNSEHLVPSLELPISLQKSWSQSIGSGSSNRGRLIVEPIAAKGHVYTMDASYRVSCFELETGDLKWDIDVSQAEWTGISLGGGLAFEEDYLYVTTAIGEVIALKSETGEEVWRTSLHYPVRAAPTVSEGRIFVLTLHNTLEALDVKTGEKIWSNAAATEIAGILGSASPAVRNGTVVVPYSSGEIMGLRAETGEMIWSDNLVSLRQTEGLKGLAHIRAHPVIDENRVYAISHSGRMVSLDLETGERLWEQEIGGICPPAVAGNFLFVVSIQGDLICLEKTTGKIKWTRMLSDLRKDLKKEEGSEKIHIHWTGPLLTQDVLLVVGSNHEVLQISPETGELKGMLEIQDKVLISPIIVQKALIFVTDTGYVEVFR